MSAVAGLGEGSDGVQWALDGVYMAGDGPSETIVQRQCVRVGAAVIEVEKKRMEKMSDAVDVTAILMIVNVRYKIQA